MPTDFPVPRIGKPRTSLVKASQKPEIGLTPTGHWDGAKYSGSFCIVTTSGICTSTMGCGEEEFGDGAKAKLRSNPSAPGLYFVLPVPKSPETVALPQPKPTQTAFSVAATGRSLPSEFNTTSGNERATGRTNLLVPGRS